ncbi:MAG TPA: MBL fold metallo-hydrolase [Ktedonobacteraceae bacterium]|nr:MBL fold metallo-hydrolase [Ktedonobacteraceae bacterium]
MQVVFVGGASGVGASCLAVEIADQWIIVDAGVRVDRKSDPLPDLALLEGKDVRAIFVTHAHADHIGALPLVHQAFPTAPIFASRATGLLMEVMLADALRIMSRRAAEEMEIPLYPPELVGSMLNQVRPLPVGETLTLPQIPHVSIHASRAGHIAGAVSFSFTGPDGTVVISGDISSTSQRTVLGAVPPPVPQCDLLVLESTYGARLHPNRQGEEQRLAQAVAESIARGGHTLIPCFGLGRGQEILLVLQAAQEKGQIPDFPIYVDGLVRRVCNTYLLLPEALPPVLQRQIRKGFLPFTGRNVSFVRDERERERILAGPPACILSSSGMLTGGPSVWYAKRLAAQEQAAILITGYQDEEAPGKRLLDLAEKKDSTLDLDGTTVQVRCHVAKYSLSAHADGGELAAYAAALKPRKVALVHGDEEARLALRRLLVETEVLLPENGSTLVPQGTQSKHRPRGEQVQTLPALPMDIGQGRRLTPEMLPELWQTVSQVPSLRIVTARELANTWYGHASESETANVLDVLDSDYEQRYFIRQQALEEAYRVRGQSEEEPGDFLSDLVGKILLTEISPGSSKPVLCQSIEPGARIRVQHPRGVDFVRSRYPFNAILDVLGEPTDEMLADRFGIAAGLDDLVKAGRRKRRRISAHELARHCQEDATYTLGDLCQLAGVSATALDDRLAIAKILYKNPLIFMQQRTLMEGEGLALYMLAPEWSEALEVPEEAPRPDQNWIQEIIQKHLGDAPDLYRRSIDPESGEVTLAFHFPAIASQQYAERLTAIAEEAGVQVQIAPRAHQGELVRLAHHLLPPGLSERGFPSIYHDSQVIQIKTQGTATQTALEAAQQDFYAQTGWQLELDVEFDDRADTQQSQAAPAPVNARLDQHAAIHTAQSLLRDLPGYLKVGADPGRWMLHARFHFPEIARQRYVERFAEVETRTGWQVHVPDGIHQEALAAMARKVLPAGLRASGSPSIYHQQQAVLIQCQGEAPQAEVLAAQEYFEQETGWQLTITVPGSREDIQQAPRMAQGEALACISAAFRGSVELYRIGVDSRLKIFWLHFHFPEKAGEQHAELIASLEQETGWRVYLHPHVHQKALVSTAQRLLPDTSQLSGKTLFPEEQLLHLVVTNLPGPQEQEEIARRFSTATGWTLQLEAGSAEQASD